MNSAPLILAASQSGLSANERLSKPHDFQMGRRPQQTASPGRDAHANGPVQEAPHRVPTDSPGAATSDTAGLLDGRVPHSDHTQRCGWAARLGRWEAFPQTPAGPSRHFGCTPAVGPAWEPCPRRHVHTAVSFLRRHAGWGDASSRRMDLRNDRGVSSPRGSLRTDWRNERPCHRGRGGPSAHAAEAQKPA